MKIAELLPTFTAFRSATKTSLEEHKTALAEANTKISDLSAKLEALEASNKVKADEDADESTEEESLIKELQQVLDKYSKDADSDTSDSDSDSDSSDDESDSDGDSSDDDATDETAKASRVEKLKALTKAAAKVVAENKAIKASVPKQVIREIAAVGIPTPLATKPDGKTTALKGLDRVAAAFAEQINNKK